MALATGLKLVMRLKSLVLLPTNKTQFLQCLTRSGIRGPDGRAWSSQSSNNALTGLQHQGLLSDEFACHPTLLHPVAIDAATSEKGEALIAAVTSAFPAQQPSSYYSSPSIDRDAVVRLLRVAIYANDGPGFVAHCELYHRQGFGTALSDILWRVFAQAPITPEWLSSRAVSIQIALLNAKLQAVLQQGIAGPDVAPLISLARSHQDMNAFAELRPALAAYALLAGQLEECRRSVEAIDPATATRPAWEGVLAFLAGRNGEALEHFRAALKLHRKAVGKRKIFLDGMPAVFAIMALLRAGDPALQAETQAALEASLTSASNYQGAFLALQVLLWLTQSLEARAREMLKRLSAAMPEEPLSAACIGVAELAVDASLAGARQSDITKRFDALHDVLPLIGRMHCEVLAEVADKPAPYATHLAQGVPGIEIAFARLLTIGQPWERALESLDAFLGAGAAKPETASAPRRAKRLVWFLDPETREIEVAEQSAKAREGWSDGRAVALKRLHERDPRLDYLTDPDRVALRSLRRAAGWYGTDEFEFDTARTIPALVGHPAVFDRRHRSRQLELVAYPLELVVADRRDGYHIGLSHTAKEATVFLEAETPTRYRVIDFPQRMLAVQEILGSRGLRVPAAARDRVIALVQRQNPKLPVRAEIDAIGQAAIEGEAAAVVQCMPIEDGMQFDLLVRPLGADGPAFVAGLGVKSVVAKIGGQQVRASRDLAREVAERSTLIEACPTLRDRARSDAHQVLIADLESSLEALLELQAYTGRVTVEWPQGKKLRINAFLPDKLKLRVTQERDWFAVGGTVDLDEEQVVEMRFLLDQLGAARGRFVPLEDGSFVALTRHLQTQLQRLAAVSEPHRAGRRVHALGAAVLDGVLAEAGPVQADKAWTRHVARIRAAESWTPMLPVTLQAELRDYQVEGFAWLSRLARWGAGACLADDMGLGKTVQAIAVMLERAADGPCLVVAPTSVCPNWEAEITRFAPTLVSHRLSEAGDRAALIAGLGARDVLICSYGLMNQAAEALSGRKWQMAVLDEAQAIKNAGTKRAQASVGLQAEFRLALSGTPVENYLDELWSLFNFINPGLLGSRESFQKRFVGPIERDRDTQAREALRALIRPFLLRRTKAAVLTELPPRTEQTIHVEMSESERAFYEALRQRAVETITTIDAKPGKRKLQILAEITRLRRGCCNPALIDAEAGVPSGKLEAFLALAGELVRNRHRALVFSQFVGHLALVRAALDAAGIGYEYLDGSTPSAERERCVAAFQSGSAALFLISLRAGGTGLNLTAADYVVHLDPWWNPAVEDQASDRAHRIGQTRPVTIYRLIMRDSIEERILDLHRDKRDMATKLLDGTEMAAQLTEDALLELISS
ncbi:MAG: DEAD/DEAH box helicase [Janthinobacterium lividum]